MAAKSIIYGVTILSILIIVGGYVSWTIAKPDFFTPSTPTGSSNPNATNAPGNTPTIPPDISNENALPDASTVGQIRDNAMNYIQANHPESASSMASLSWNSGTKQTDSNGSETYTYTSSGWNVTIQFPNEPDPTFSITATYNSGTITWVGNSFEGTIAEMSFSSDTQSLLSAQNQVRDAVMTFIRTRHPETATLMTLLQWVGQIDDSGAVGTTNYDYFSGGWTVVLQISAASPSSFIVTADYVGDNYVSWQGTYQNATISETSFSSSFPTPIPTPVRTPTPAPTPSPIPTPTRTPTPTPPPTRTPSPSPIPTKTPTPTPTATAKP